MDEEESSKTGFLKAQILQDKKTDATGCLWKTNKTTPPSPSPPKKLVGFRPILQAWDLIYDFEMAGNILKYLCTQHYAG